MVMGLILVLVLALTLESRDTSASTFRRLGRLSLSKVGCKSRLYGRDPDGSPLGERWDEEVVGEGGPQGKSSSSLDRALSSLQFGYESNTTTTILRGTARKPQVVCSSPKNIPMRGCNMEESTSLTKRTKATTLKALRQLPCFDDGVDGTGSCPYVRLRCSKGHEWKAVPGSEMSFRCPTCEQASKSSMKTAAVMKKKKRVTTPRKPKVSILESMATHAEGRGGKCLLTSENATALPLHWNSSVPFECSKGHCWSATAVNILKKASWCAQCLAEERLFLMQETAAAFGGEFLGFVDDFAAMTRQLRYQVLGGTFGLEYDDFEPTTGMFKTRDGHFDAPKWPSSDTVKRKKGGVNGDQAWLDDLVVKSSGKRAKAYSQSPAYWRCANGHTFIQSSNNIRRRRGSARKCSWCPECTKSGLRFEWEETTAEKSFGLKQYKPKAAKAQEGSKKK